MTCYHFHVLDGDVRTDDAEGKELPHISAVQAYALSVAAEFAYLTPLKGNQRTIVVDAKDESGRLIYKATAAIVGEWIA